MRMYGYNACFRPPKKRTARQMFFIIVLCVALPPVGLLLLFGKSRCSARGKVILSGVALVCMTVMLVSCLRVLHPPKQVGYVPINTAVTPIIVGSEAGVSATPVPANPLG